PAFAGGESRLPPRRTSRRDQTRGSLIRRDKSTHDLHRSQCCHWRVHTQASDEFPGDQGERESSRREDVISYQHYTFARPRMSEGNLDSSALDGGATERATMAMS